MFFPPFHLISLGIFFSLLLPFWSLLDGARCTRQKSASTLRLVARGCCEATCDQQVKHREQIYRCKQRVNFATRGPRERFQMTKVLTRAARSLLFIDMHRHESLKSQDLLFKMDFACLLADSFLSPISYDSVFSARFMASYFYWWFLGRTFN